MARRSIVTRMLGPILIEFLMGNGLYARAIHMIFIQFEKGFANVWKYVRKHEERGRNDPIGLLHEAIASLLLDSW